MFLSLTPLKTRDLSVGQRQNFVKTYVFESHTIENTRFERWPSGQARPKPAQKGPNRPRKLKPVQTSPKRSRVAQTGPREAQRDPRRPKPAQRNANQPTCPDNRSRARNEALQASNPRVINLGPAQPAQYQIEGASETRPCTVLDFRTKRNRDTNAAI